MTVWQWASMDNTRTLKLKQLNGIQPSFVLLSTPFSDMSKCVLSKRPMTGTTASSYLIFHCDTKSCHEYPSNSNIYTKRYFLFLFIYFIFIYTAWFIEIYVSWERPGQNGSAVMLWTSTDTTGWNVTKRGRKERNTTLKRLVDLSGQFPLKLNLHTLFH